MTLFQVVAQGRHGYPQPEDGFDKATYTDCRLRCGIHGSQIVPFRLKRSLRVEHSGFLQLNWVFDAFFIQQDVASDLAAAGFSGISFGPVLDHRSGVELGNRVQLVISTIIACAETSQLPAVTCRPGNEEARFALLAGRKRYTPETPYCGTVNHHQPKSPAVDRGALEKTPAAPDLFQTAEWFGSGGEAHRLTLCRERFAELVRQRGWRGIEFRTVKG